MRFVIAPPLLEALRRRRDEQRGVVREHGRPRSLVGSLPELFEKNEPAPMAAAYVAGMNTLQVEVEDREDAFLLDPGMGPMTYLTRDGRVLLDFRSWDGDPLREATDDEAIMALVVGAEKTGLAELLSLIPPRPVDGHECPKCHGARRAPILPESSPMFVCLLCSGRGWTDDARIAEAKAKGIAW